MIRRQLLICRTGQNRICFSIFIVKEVVFFDDFAIISEWQHFGNKKSVSQNKLCNRSKKGIFTTET